MSILTKELRKLGFLCGVEQELYIQDTGKHTSLIIEGEQEGDDTEYYYDFYKQTYYPQYKNTITVYGEHMNTSQLLERVERYFINRKKYIEEMKERR